MFVPMLLQAATGAASGSLALMGAALGAGIAVIGAGPAGLTYASLVADGNTVTVFEKAGRAGGSFRFAGLAPMFQEVPANPVSLERYIKRLEDLEALACGCPVVARKRGPSGT